MSFGAAPGATSLSNAALWVEQVLTGSLSTSAAIIAVAVVGLGMLYGRINVKRALTVILGCFILFGASTIARGLTGLGGAGASAERAQSSPPPLSVPVPDPAPRQDNAYDPYAGAAVPGK
jgi:type IV secretion system protein VirB2